MHPYNSIDTTAAWKKLRFILSVRPDFHDREPCLPSRKLYKLDEPDTQDTTRKARTNSSVMYSYGPPHMTKQKQDDQLEHTYSSYVKIRDVALKTWQKRWTIGRSGERGSVISVLAARHDDDDDDNYISIGSLYLLKIVLNYFIIVSLLTIMISNIPILHIQWAEFYGFKYSRIIQITYTEFYHFK